MGLGRGAAAGVEERVVQVEVAAVGNYGLIRRADVTAANLGSSVVERLCAEGRWRRIERGVFAVTALGEVPLQAEAAALWAAGRRSFLQSISAARAHGGLDLPLRGAASAAIAPPSSGRGATRRHVPEQHIVEVDGLRTTDGLQTLLDLASVLDDTTWEWALEAALRQRLTTIEEIESALAAPGRKARDAVARVRRVLASRPLVAPATGSVLETRFVQLCRRIGAPDPQRQVEVITAGGNRYFVDLAWPELGVFVELDGQQHLGQPVYDASRQTAIVAATGWLCARFTWTEVVRIPKPTGRKLLGVLGHR